MIQVNELRSGIIVNTPNPQQNPFRIDFFDESKVYQKNGTYEVPGFGSVPFHELTWDLKDIEPIPLTEEWLVRFGFEKAYPNIDWVKRMSDLLPTEIDHIYHKNDCVMAKAVDIDGYAIPTYGSYGLDIDHVHQLQNLYFALTGKELEFK